MTDARSGGLQSPVFAGLEQFVISGAGIAGRGTVRAGKAAIALTAGVFQARAILSRIHAGAVVGFGGYPCVAPALAARLMRHRPTVILHEQNAVLGRANRYLARHADMLALSFAATERVPESAKTVVTGNPVRPAIAALAARPVCAAHRHAAPAGAGRLARCARIQRHRSAGAGRIARRPALAPVGRAAVPRRGPCQGATKPTNRPALRPNLRRSSPTWPVSSPMRIW